MSFASTLTGIVREKKNETKDKKTLGLKWADHEDKLIAYAVDAFKQQCVEAAGRKACGHTGSFEVLTRTIPGFPSRSLVNDTYIVSDWGAEGLNAQAWAYGTRGVHTNFDASKPVLFAEVLASTMQKFMDQLPSLGFETCEREVGTWKVKVTWNKPEKESDEESDEPPAQQNGAAKSAPPAVQAIDSDEDNGKPAGEKDRGGSRSKSKHKKKDKHHKRKHSRSRSRSRRRRHRDD